MPRYVALLRGVNVGRAKRVPMADWRALLGGLGCEDVRTILNSGNAVFDSSERSAEKLAGLIREAIADKLAVDVPVIVKSEKDLLAIVRGNELAALATDASRLLVAFTRDAGSLAALAALAPLVKAPERFHLGERAAYLWCADGILASKAATALLGKAGRDATTRNWATVLKIRDLLQGALDPVN
ncbi:MAG: DUF1697 domain-containing protein [Lysobacter sp.]|nr:DUF1697 domain-containing protein [Lysobacter sp.]